MNIRSVVEKSEYVLRGYQTEPLVTNELLLSTYLDDYPWIDMEN